MEWKDIKECHKVPAQNESLELELARMDREVSELIR